MVASCCRGHAVADAVARISEFGLFSEVIAEGVEKGRGDMVGGVTGPGFRISFPGEGSVGRPFGVPCCQTRECCPSESLVLCGAGDIGDGLFGGAFSGWALALCRSPALYAACVPVTASAGAEFRAHTAGGRLDRPVAGRHLGAGPFG